MTGFQYKLSFFLQIPQTIGNNGESWSPPKYQFVMMHIPSHNFFYILLPSQIMVEIECFAHQRGGLEALHFADPQQINNNGNAAPKGLWCLPGMDQQHYRKQGVKGDQLPGYQDILPCCNQMWRRYKKCDHIFFCKDTGHQIKSSENLKQIEMRGEVGITS